MKFKALALFALSLVAALSLSLLSSAASSEPDYSDVNLKIVSKNLSYRDSIHLLVACDNDGVDPSKIELVFWNYVPESVSDEPTYVDTTSSPYYDKSGELMFESVFESYGISAKDMSDTIYMAAHIKDTDIYSEIYRYSPLEYLYERMSFGQSTDEQLVFYDSVIAYSENAQIILNHDVENSPNDLNYVAVKGGTISDGYSAGTYRAGSEITISASNPDDFSMWTNSEGEVISYEPTFTTKANDKTSLFISISGYSITVNVGDKSTTTVHVPGDVVTLTAPAYVDTDGGRQYFVAWKNSAGEAVSSAASTKITVTATESYTATYSLVSDIAGSTLLDYETSDQTPIIADSPSSNSEISSDYTSVLRRRGTDGYYIRVGSARDLVSPKEYVNTFFTSSSSATSATFSFDFKLYEMYDDNGNMTRDCYTGSSDSNTLYTLIYTVGSITRSIRINIITENDIPTGFSLVDESDKTLATVEINAICNISVEISKLGDKTLSAVYLGGEMIDLTETDASYAASSSASLSLCIGSHTRSDVYIDNTVFYSLD